MNKLPIITVCPSLLREGYHSYSPEALKRLFAGAIVPHRLSFSLQTSSKNTTTGNKQLSEQLSTLKTHH